MIRTRALALVVLLGLAGCNGDEGASSSTSGSGASSAPSVKTAATSTGDADGVQYVALGDSYASGLGAGDYDDSGCGRSAHSYPRLVAEQRGYHLEDRTCAGATIASVRADGLSALNEQTDAVTVTVGGNDLVLMRALGLCGMPNNDSACAAVFADGTAQAEQELRGPLAQLYRDVKAAAPNAEIVALGYPRLFETGRCPSEPGYSAGERVILNKAADTLNKIVTDAAGDAGIRAVTPVDAFAGHGVCSAKPWIHGTSGATAANLGESLHPTKEGQAAYARVVPQL